MPATIHREMALAQVCSRPTPTSAMDRDGRRAREVSDDPHETESDDTEPWSPASGGSKSGPPMVLTGTGLSGEGGSLSEEPTPAHRGSWGQMGGSTAWPSPAHPTRSSQLPHARHLTVEAEETAGISAGSPDPGGGGGPSKKSKIPRKRDTSGYGVFVNRCLPRLITAANFPKKPAYKCVAPF